MGMVVCMVQFSNQKLQEYIETPSKFEEDLESLEDGETEHSLYLDKTWEAIHYLLTGTNIGNGEKPLSLAIYSEQFFDEGKDLGMGPASYITPTQVKDIYYAIAIIDKKFLAEKYKPVEMTKADIYPGGWDENPAALFENASNYFFKLQAFYKDAAARNNAVASYIS